MTGRSECVWFEVEERIEATLAEVFEHLIDPAQYVRWMGAEAVLEPRPGGTYRVHIPHRGVARGEFVTVEAPHRIVFTWGWDGDGVVPPGSSTVEVTLHERDGATLVRLRHSGLPDEESGRAHEGGWRKYLGRLDAVTTGGNPGPDVP
ncbi:MAG TPA: SRPBCC domain-containing protein [Actinomycetota bacterium]